MKNLVRRSVDSFRESTENLKQYYLVGVWIVRVIPLLITVVVVGGGGLFLFVTSYWAVALVEKLKGSC